MASLSRGWIVCLVMGCISASERLCSTVGWIACSTVGVSEGVDWINCAVGKDIWSFADWCSEDGFWW